MEADRSPQDRTEGREEPRRGIWSPFHRQRERVASKHMKTIDWGVVEQGSPIRADDVSSGGSSKG